MPMPSPSAAAAVDRGYRQIKFRPGVRPRQRDAQRVKQLAALAADFIADLRRDGPKRVAVERTLVRQRRG